MPNFKVFLLSLGVLAVAFTAPAQGVTEIDTDKLTAYLDLAGRLRHGDSCSWKTEQLRQIFTATAARVGTDQQKVLAATADFINKIVGDGEPLCSALSLTVCNKETETCECGDPGKVAILGLEEGTKGFALERSNDGQKKCRWATGEGCAPSDYLEKLSGGVHGGIEVDSNCQDGTSCKTVGGQRSSCTFIDMVIYAIANRKTDAQALSKDIFNGKICTCQSNSRVRLLDESDSDLTRNQYESSRRIRRFAQLQPAEPLMEAAAAAGFLPSLMESL